MRIRRLIKRLAQAAKLKKIIVLIDLENLLRNLNTPPERFSLADGFDNLMEQLAKIGRVTNVFVFGPPHSIDSHLETLDSLGFTSIPCSKEETKEGEKIDTVDSRLVQFGKEMITQIPDLTHLCLGSGDRDFIPFLRWAKRQGLKIIIAAGNIDSLSGDLIGFAQMDPATGKRRVYLFAPTKDYH